MMKFATLLLFLSFGYHPIAGSFIRQGSNKGSNKNQREALEFFDLTPTTAPKTDLRLPTTSSLVITLSPTARPSIRPSEGPSHSPSYSSNPSVAPTFEPSSIPSYFPSESPSAKPSPLPSQSATIKPSDTPSDIPSDVPSDIRSNAPSNAPSNALSVFPSDEVSMSPTKQPTTSPTELPTFAPTKEPTAKPFYSLIEAGNDGNPGAAFPLGRCEGDCDNNGDCEGDLICFQRNENDEVPGCRGDADAAMDYCTDKAYGGGVYNFQLRLYWKSGYNWQESDEETWWCMECAKCDSHTLEDGVDADCVVAGSSGSSCREEHNLWIRKCKDDRRDFKFNIITNPGSGDQVRVAGTNLCLSTVNNKYLELKSCNEASSRQLFAPIENLSKFLLRPYNQRNWTDNVAKCVSQLHHPKDKEVLGLHHCERARNDQTMYWEEYYR